uniref:Uncharacterized protein n=1 Tax=Aegilops tauschii subsp. strangulata TaxID=200361 RepID=A0A453T421_AEGTS
LPGIATTMGNAAPRGPAVEERLTQPRRLVRQLSDLDSDRLRRLIRSGDLAPCFDAAEEDGRAVECPICFHVLLPEFESIQVLRQRDLHSCPFCKTAAYAVEYRGARTLSEKKLQREVSFQPRDSDQHKNGSVACSEENDKSPKFSGP